MLQTSLVQFATIAVSQGGEGLKLEEPRPVKAVSRRRWSGWLAAALLGGAMISATAQTNTEQVIYDGQLENGWQDWGWATLDFGCTNPVLEGFSASISVSCAGYQALYLHAAAVFDSSPYTNLSFWINGGTGGQAVQVQAVLDSNALTNTIVLPPLPANTWTQIDLSLSDLGAADQPNFGGFWIQNQSADTIPTFYVDAVELTGPPEVTTNVAVSVQIDANGSRLPISPLIYGVAFGAANQLSDLNFTLNRSGGNEETTDNWQINAHGKGADWYFENYSDGNGTTPGATMDSFVAGSKNGGAQPLITLSMIGWMPKLGPGQSIIWSYSQAKYGPQTGQDPYHTDAGNGVSVTNNTLITWNKPTDAYFPTNVLFEQGLVQHFLSNWGASTNGGVHYYILDNEHSIWFSTHQDIHPVGPTMTEIYTDMVATASMVKSNDPNALVLGPEEWGWSGYLYSGYDQQWAGQHNNYNPAAYPDRSAHGGWDYMPWLLNQFHQHDTNSGTRLLDYFTLHCYPQAGDVSSASDVSAATCLLRNQTTRDFWDTNYTDPSWVNSVIALIPTMKQWVATNYPGTKIGVTEYNWGAEGNINGATAQADLLGIFGQYGLDLATRWGTPDTGTPTYNAMKLYRNYDGKNSTFGDTSISATGPNPDDVAIHAAVRLSDGALTIMAINKQLNSDAVTTFSISNFAARGTAQVWQVTSTNAITQLSTIAFAGQSFTNTLPAQSITLLVVAPGTPVTPAFSSIVKGAGGWQLSFNAQGGQVYRLLASSNLKLPMNQWTVVTNGIFGSGKVTISDAQTSQARFYRLLSP